MNTALSKKTLPSTSSVAFYRKFTRKIALVTIVLFTVFWFITHPEITKSAVTEALSFCFSTLVPSLLPFAIAGEILVLSGSGDIFKGIFGSGSPLGSGASAFLLGALCGFPIGGRTAIRLYENGELEKDEAELLCAASNNAGAGFVISGIGSAMWKNTAFGVTLYLVQLFSAVMSAIILKPLFKKGKNAPRIRDNKKISQKEPSFSSMISLAVPNAVSAMLKICGFVVFFEIVLSAVSFYVADPVMHAALSVFLELTSGVTALLRLTSDPTFELLAEIGTFFAVGYGGLSVHAQLFSFAEGSGISVYRYELFKLVQASICALTGAAALRFLPL